MESNLIQTKCRQEYAEFKMMGIDSNNADVVLDTFSYPVGCSCAYKDLSA